MPPPAWSQAFAKPGRPDAELSACLKDKAYQALDVHVPDQAKAAGIIAQCEVEVDRLEGTSDFGGAGSGRDRDAVEQRAQREAAAAIAAYRNCPAG